MNVLDAAYHTVHDYPGGAAALAARMGRAAARVSHEVRPPAGSTHKLGLLDAVKYMEMTDDYRIIEAMALQLGCLVVRLPDLEERHPCANHTAAVAQRFGDLMAEVAKDTADGQITTSELRRLEREWGELVSAGTKMMAHFAALHEKISKRGEHG